MLYATVLPNSYTGSTWLQGLTKLRSKNLNRTFRDYNNVYIGGSKCGDQCALYVCIRTLRFDDEVQTSDPSQKEPRAFFQ